MLAWLALAGLAGVWVGSATPISTTTWAALMGGSCLLALLLRRRQFSFKGRLGPAWMLGLVLAAMMAGGWREAAARQAGGQTARYNDRPGAAVVEGWVRRPARAGDGYQVVTVQAERVQVGDMGAAPVDGVIVAFLPEGERWRYGEQVRLTGKLVTPWKGEGFSYRDYLKHQGIYSVLQGAHGERLGQGGGNPVLGWIFALRERSLAVVGKLYPDPEGALLKGILLGDDGGIPAQVEQAFQRTGTAHVIAISGFNMTLVAGMLMGLAGGWFGRWRGAALAALGVVGYTLLAGAEPGVVRAAVMACIGLLGKQIGREQQGLHSLGVTAGAMVLATPGVLWQVSFQLSAAATAGLILFSEPLMQALRAGLGKFLKAETVQRVSGPVGEYGVMTLAAQLAALPVMVYHFGQMGWPGLVVNPLILPVQPLLMVWGGLSVMAGLVFLPLGRLAALVAWPLAAYTIRMVGWWGETLGGSLSWGEGSAWGVAGYGAGLAGWLWLRGNVEKIRPWLRPSLGLMVLSVAGMAAWTAGLQRPDGQLRMTFLAGGQGVVLVEGPTGRTVVINSGESSRDLSAALGERLPLFGREVDAVLVSGRRREENEALLGLLERVPVNAIWWSGEGPGRGWQDPAGGFGGDIEQAYLAAGSRADLGGGAWLEVLATGKYGSLLLVRLGNYRALLVRGVLEGGLEGLIEEHGLRGVSVLVAESVDEQGWVEALAPRLVVNGAERGWIEVRTDGERMWVEAER